MELWDLDLWSNKNISYLFNEYIAEYDLEEAGYSLIREYSLLSNNELEKLKDLDKKERHVAIGKIQRDNINFSKDLQKSFVKARKLFITENQLDIFNILSIKKDAIFVSKKCKYEKFGCYLNFREKNTYTSYIYLNKNIEIFYNNGEVTIKGMGKDTIEEQKKYMISFLSSYFHRMETEKPVDVIEYVKRFIDKYKYKRLEAGYYQEFRRRGTYRLEANLEKSLGDKTHYINPDSVESSQLLDISYNFYNLLLKLIQVPL